VFFTATAKNLMLDAMDESLATGMKFGSLHSAYSATGANELAGGAPAYARKGLTWAAAAGGSKALAATLPVWDVPAGAVARWIGFWDAVSAGTFLGMMPVGGGALQEFAVDDLVADTLKAESHGFVDGDQVVVWGAGIPSDLAVGTIYFVVTATTHTLQLSLTSGGAAINFADRGEGHLQRIIPETFGSQGTLSQSSGSIDLNAIQ
jgi:hypothetical protein